MRDIYDEILDDIETQEKKKPTQFDINEVATDFDPRPQSLEDIPQYAMTDLDENNFDINYRTPNFVFEEGPKRSEQLIGTLLPEEITVTDNIDNYTDKKMRGLNQMFPGRMEYDKDEVRKKYEDDSQEKGGWAAVYHPVLDEIIVDKAYIKKATLPQMNRTLIHENVHKLERDIEYRRPTPRVLSEPNKDMFQQMYNDNTVRNDFTNYLKGNKLGFGPQRQEILKDRRSAMKEYKDYTFPEQLAYVGEEIFSNAIKNPRSKTERVLNRMWFQWV